MRNFLDENFLLHSATAGSLYHNYASPMPIIDYHSHLVPREIAEDTVYENISKVWLSGDHYKWRAMRAMGVEEKYITGDISDVDKFKKWAEVLPFTVRNPLFHWSQLELRNYFGINELLSVTNAEKIYDACNEKLNSSGYSCRELLRKMHVEVLCTTDDPTDDLEHHIAIKNDGFEIKVLPTFRADNCLFTDDPIIFNKYIDKLAFTSDIDIPDLEGLFEALTNRHDYFHNTGCRLSDNGLAELASVPYTGSEVKEIFSRLRSGKNISTDNKLKYQSAILMFLGHLNHDKGWVQQYHLGALRNVNSRMMDTLGKDTGFDSIGDFNQGKSLGAFLDSLDREDKLAKTILYNLNPRDNELFATMAGNFNTGGIKGKIQYGAAWWYLDQKDGIEKQLNTLSNMGMLSCFVGMLTDSRSILSYPRHEYFRRVLCNLIGNDVEKGELPNDQDLLGGIVENVCYNNAKVYFNF